MKSRIPLCENICCVLCTWTVFSPQSSDPKRGCIFKKKCVMIFSKIQEPFYVKIGAKCDVIIPTLHHFNKIENNNWVALGFLLKIHCYSFETKTWNGSFIVYCPLTVIFLCIIPLCRHRTRMSSPESLFLTMCQVVEWYASSRRLPQDLGNTFQTLKNLSRNS